MIKNLRNENENYRLAIQGYQEQSLERESRHREENDKMIDRLQEVLSRGIQSDSEKESLKKYFLSKQHELNESVIKEQNDIIASLQNRCLTYENDLQKVGNLDGKLIKIIQLKIDELIKVFRFN